jgi:hypothetical protein
MAIDQIYSVKIKKARDKDKKLENEKEALKQTVKI